MIHRASDDGRAERCAPAEHRRAARRKPMSEINVVPYIDVMLVLLIIFMVTAPLLSQGVKVDLPQADAEPIDTRDERTPGGERRRVGALLRELRRRQGQAHRRPDPGHAGRRVAAAAARAFPSWCAATGRCPTGGWSTS